MNIQEVLEKSNITHDDKARRVLNTAPETLANISINELEQGVTIEKLESLNVPVYQYGTQITIHGIFKDLPSDFRVCGYKSIILNQNQSLGVKYSAIDAKKKKLLEKISWKISNRQWTIHIDSQGCDVFKIFHETNEQSKQQAINCYKSTPDDLYIGGKEIGVLMYGFGYYVLIHIGAIYKNNFWQLVKALFGISNPKEFGNLIIEHRIQRKKEHEKYIAEQKQREIEQNAKLQQARDNFKIPDNWQVFNGQILEAGTYAKISLDYSNIPYLLVFKILKFGKKIKIASKSFPDFNFVDWTPSKYHITESKKINGYRILDKQIPVETKTETLTDTPTIRHNEKLNGIEILFDNKPSQNILDGLKNLGFRWSQYNKLWYSRYTENTLAQVKLLLNIESIKSEV